MEKNDLIQNDWISQMKKLARGNVREYGLVIALLVITLFFSIATGGVLLRPMNVTNLIMQNSYILIMAIGMMMIIITGFVDLSVGSVVGATGALSAILIVNHQVPVFWAIVICLIFGVMVGCFQGFFVAYMKIPPFITTLAGMLIFRGVTLAVLSGRTIGPYPLAFSSIANGFVSHDVLGMDVVSLLLGLAVILFVIFSEMRNRNAKKKYNLETMPVIFSLVKVALISTFIGFIAYMLSSHNGMPIILIIMLMIACIYSFIMKNTTLGRHIYSVGGNPTAAKLSGINTDKIMFLVYANMGLLSALSGIIISGRLNAATPNAGTGFELEVIAACFIGGASTSGGIGKIVGGLVGAMVIGILNNGMSIMGIPVDFQRIIMGCVLLAAVCFDLYAKKRSTN